jgi:uncharacterized membrane-anchored protein YitT (DUF2179 family)
MPHRQYKKECVSHLLYRLVMIVIGASSAALSIELFLVSNKIIDGELLVYRLYLDYILQEQAGFLDF